MKRSSFLFLLPLVLFSPVFATAKTFTSIEVKYEKTDKITLGQTIRIGIVAINDKDKEFKTPGFLSPGLLKTVEWDQFSIEVEGGTYDNGTITISGNSSDIKNHQVKIKATCIKDPEVKAELSIALNYKGRLLVVMDGEHGQNGRRGQAGSKGAFGSSSIVATSGSIGGSGGNGSDGGDGPKVSVYITVKKNAGLKKDMIYIKAVNETTGEEKILLADPNESEMIIAANGGNGGIGGQGGQGGEGGDNSSKHTSCNGGQGGQGGQGGDGGKGGSIAIYMDPSTDKVNATLNYSNAGGLGGYAGDGGDGGFKGIYESINGPKGANGTKGNEGTKGPTPKIINQKVEIND